MDRIDFPYLLRANSPRLSVRLCDALLGAGVRNEEFAAVANDPQAIRVVAAFIVSFLEPKDDAKTEVWLSEPHPDWCKQWVKCSTLFPSMSEDTPTWFTRGLLFAGVRVHHLELMLRRQEVVTAVAEIVRKKSGNPFVLELPAAESEQVNTRQDVCERSTHHARGVPCTVNGIGFETGRGLLKRLKDRNMVSEDAMEQLLETDACWVRRGRFTFRCVPSSGFEGIPYRNILRTLRLTYPRFNHERIEMPLALAFSQCLHESGTLSQLKGRVEWVRVLHKPFVDAAGHPKTLVLKLDRSRKLAGIELVLAPELGDRFELNGAFAALVGE